MPEGLSWHENGVNRSRHSDIGIKGQWQPLVKFGRCIHSRLQISRVYRLARLAAVASVLSDWFQKQIGGHDELDVCVLVSGAPGPDYYRKKTASGQFLI